MKLAIPTDVMTCLGPVPPGPADHQTSYQVGTQSQSGERFEGVENFREWRRRYPAELTFHTRRISHRADLVVENLNSYDGGPWMFTVNLPEFKGDRVAHERIYIMDGWDAAEWRAPWRSDVPADQLRRQLPPLRSRRSRPRS